MAITFVDQTKAFGLSGKWHVFDVTSDLVGDPAGVDVPHGFGVIPDLSILETITVKADVAIARTAAWLVAGRDATNVSLDKVTGAGTFGPNAQVRLHVVKDIRRLPVDGIGMLLMSQAMRGGNPHNSGHDGGMEQLFPGMAPEQALARLVSIPQFPLGFGF